MTTKTKRTKLDTAKVITRPEAVAAFGSFTAAYAEVSQINADLDRKIAELRAAQTLRLMELNATLKSQMAVMHAYAKANKADFGSKKSMELQFGRIGFRTGQPALVLLSKVKWDDVLENMQAHDVLKSYVIDVPEIQKVKLIADRALPDMAVYFEAVGIKVEQKETFFVEPKVEEMEDVA